MSRRSRGSRRWSAHRMWWPELFWPRAQAGELIGGEKLGLYTAVEFDPVSRRVSRKISEVVGARNLGMAHLVVRSTCDDRRPMSGEGDLTVPAGQGLGPSLGKLHGLSGKLSKGSGEVGGLREWLDTAAVVGWWWRVVVEGGGACSLRRTAVISSSVRSVGMRGSTTEALWALIGVGTGTGARSGVARRGCAVGRALACQPRSSTWRLASARVQALIGSKSS